MTAIVWKDFKGILPRRDEHLLPGVASTRAHHVNLSRGRIEPWSTPIAIDNVPPQTQSITCEPCFLAWDEKNVRAMPISPGDSPGYRLYAIDHPDGPQVATETDLCKKKLYPLGVPTPGTPSISAGAGCDCGTTPVTVRVSYVRNHPYNQESALSMPSNTILAGQGGTVNVSASPPSGYSMRVYATLGAPAGQDGQLGADTGVSGYFYVTNGRSFTFESVGEGELAPNDDWYAPPDDLHKLVADDNGVLFGVSGKREVWASYPHQYHAFPGDMTVVLDDDILDIRLLGGTHVLVFTTGHPYVLAYDKGTTTVQVSKYHRPMPCSDPDAIAVGHSGAIYPSTNGLVFWDSKKFSMLSESFWTPEQWRDMLDNGAMRALTHEGNYYFWPEEDSQGYRLPFGDSVHQADGQKSMLTSIDKDCFLPSMHCISDDDDLFYMQEGNGVDVFRWAPSSRGECSCGYEMLMPITTTMGLDTLRSLWFDYIAGSGDVHWEILKANCDEWEVVDEGDVVDCRPFNFRRLHVRQYQHALRLSGCGIIRMTAIGTSFRAIAEAVNNV